MQPHARFGTFIHNSFLTLPFTTKSETLTLLLPSHTTAMNPNSLHQRAFISQSLKASIGTAFPTCLRPNRSKADTAIKKNLSLSVAKFTFTTELSQDGWNELFDDASRLQSPTDPDFVWTASEQNNRHFYIFPTWNSMEELFDCPGLLTGRNMGW